MDAGKRGWETAGAGRRFLETPQGAHAWGVQHWCHGTSVLGRRRWPWTQHPHLPQPPYLVSNQSSGLASVWGQALNVRRCPPLSLCQAGASWGCQTCVGTRAFWHSSSGERAGPDVLHKGAGVWGGGSYTIPSGLGKAGELKGPWQLPRPLCPGKETTA